MYTHLIIRHDDAEILFDAFAPKALKPGEAGFITEATLDEHFKLYGRTHLRKLGASLELDYRTGNFILMFREYLAYVPEILEEMFIRIKSVEIRRFDTAPTSAKAGYYEFIDPPATATVERVVSRDSDKKSVYVQNIIVTARDLEEAQRYNTLLSTGQLGHRMVNAFE